MTAAPSSTAPAPRKGPPPCSRCPTPAPGAATRSPFLLTEGEFSALAIGLAQRATLLEAVLADVYGPRSLIRDGHLPPALVYPAASYVRACRTTMPDAPPPGRHVHLYAADLARGPDGAWRVLADRTGEPAGLAYALENRRIMARVLPELFRGAEVTQPALVLRHLAGQPAAAWRRPVPPNPGLALLTPGHSDPRWFEHVVLARTLGCALVEDGDLTVRDGAVWVKTPARPAAGARAAAAAARRRHRPAGTDRRPRLRHARPADAVGVTAGWPY